MTVRDLFPDQLPSLSLNFAKVKALDPRITFTRASSATYVDSAGVWQEVAANVPRFDHSPTTNESLGLLVEEQRTNTFTNPRMLNGVPGTPGTQPTAMGNWNLSTSGLTIEYVQNVTYNNLTGVRYRLSGTAAATATVSNLFAPLSTGWTASSGQNWTGSVFIAVQSGIGTVNNFRLQMSARAGGGTAGASTSASLISSLTAIPTRFSQTYANVPGTTTGIFHQVLIGVTSGAAVDITFDLYWPQLEEGLFATSTILPPGTTIAASTRAADSASMTGTNFSSWYNQTEGTFYAEYSSTVANQDGAGRRLVGISDGTNDNRIVSSYGGGGGVSTGFIWAGGVEQFSTTADTMGTSSGKAVLAYKANDIAYSFNSNTVRTDNSATIPTVTRMQIGSTETGTLVAQSTLNGRIKTILYYQYRVPNTELQALTR